MELKDGSVAGGILLGLIFVAVGGYGTYYFLSAAGQNRNAIWLPLIAIAVGIIFLFGKSSISVVIDKSQEEIAFVRKCLAGSRVNSHNIADALRVELRRGSHYAPSDRPGFSVSGGNHVLQSQTVIVFKDGTEMPLENQKSRSSGGNLIGAGVMMAGEEKELAV